MGSEHGARLAQQLVGGRDDELRQTVDDNAAHVVDVRLPRRRVAVSLGGIDSITINKTEAQLSAGVSHEECQSQTFPCTNACQLRCLPRGLAKP